jgi:hypothetical protein
MMRKKMWKKMWKKMRKKMKIPMSFHDQLEASWAQRNVILIEGG